MNTENLTAVETIAGKYARTLIDVTPQMVEAGLAEFRDHRYDTGVRYMLESVYRAMAYANLDASSTSPSK